MEELKEMKNILDQLRDKEADLKQCLFNLKDAREKFSIPEIDKAIDKIDEEYCLIYQSANYLEKYIKTLFDFSNEIKQNSMQPQKPFDISRAQMLAMLESCQKTFKLKYNLTVTELNLMIQQVKKDL